MIGAAGDFDCSSLSPGDLTSKGCCCYVLFVRDRVGLGGGGDLGSHIRSP